MKNINKVLAASAVGAVILVSGIPVASAMPTTKEHKPTAIVPLPTNKTVAKTCELKTLFTNRSTKKFVTYKITYVTKTHKVKSAKLVKHNLGWMSFTLMALPSKNTVVVTQHYGIFPVNGCTLTV